MKSVWMQQQTDASGSSSGGAPAPVAPHHQQQQAQQQEQYLLLADPYLLRFTPEQLEERYQQHVAAWCAHVDVPAAVVLAIMAAVGLAYTAAKGMSDCVWGITGVSMLSAGSQLLLLLAAGRRLRSSWRARAAVLALFRLMESGVTVAFNNKCNTFWDLSVRRFTQSLLWDSGAGQLIISATFKPLPLRHAAIVQAASWAATAIASVRPWCARYAKSQFHAPLLQRAYVFLTPLNLGVDFGAPGAVPSARCCCVPVVLLVTFLFGLVVPLALCHAADYAMRSRFARSAGMGLPPWPWAVEVGGGMIVYSLFYLVTVAVANSWSSCPLPHL